MDDIQLYQATKKRSNEEKLSLYCRFVKGLKYLPEGIRDACYPFASRDHDNTFLRLMSHLRNKEDRELQEMMFALDAICGKSQALLAYISISVAALLFMITGIQNNWFNFMLLKQKIVFDFIYILLIVQSIAMVLCLTCVNIIGAHTTLRIKTKDREKEYDEYKNIVKDVTINRRSRYLISQRLSVFSAVGLIFLFIIGFTSRL